MTSAQFSDTSRIHDKVIYAFATTHFPPLWRNATFGFLGPGNVNSVTLKFPIQSYARESLTSQYLPGELRILSECPNVFVKNYMDGG